MLYKRCNSKRERKETLHCHHVDPTLEPTAPYGKPATTSFLIHLAFRLCTSLWNAWASMWATDSYIGVCVCVRARWCFCQTSFWVEGGSSPCSIGSSSLSRNSSSSKSSSSARRCIYYILVQHLSTPAVRIVHCPWPAARCPLPVAASKYACT